MRNSLGIWSLRVFWIVDYALVKYNTITLRERCLECL